MSPAAQSHSGGVMVASPRAALREKLLKIIGPVSPPSIEAAGGAEALLKLKEGRCSTLLLDQRIEDLDVEELVGTIRERYPKLNVVVLGCDDDVKSLPCEFGNGAFRQSLLERSPVARAAAAYWGGRLSPGAVAVDGATGVEPLPGMIGDSVPMREVYRLARLVAARDSAVLIAGDTGTGKEMVARGIHQLSPRRAGPLVVVNCAAIPETLLEAELFGLVRGAVEPGLGPMHSAEGGVLLLDEVGELPPSAQSKLLRFVQEGQGRRVGGSDAFRLNARVIASTSVGLLERVREGRFRKDLYFRLAVFPIELPPLRDRAQDILRLARHFLDSLCSRAGLPSKNFNSRAENRLLLHSWPGNVRELQHCVERAFVLAQERGEIEEPDLALSSERLD